MELRLDGGPGTLTPNYTVSIYSATSNQRPDSLLGTLTNPASLVVGLNTFTAPAGGIQLEPDATYVVVFDPTNQGTLYAFTMTLNDLTDLGAADGWSFLTGHFHRDYDATAGWNTSPAVLQAVIRGEINPDPPTVSNRDQANQHTDDSMKMSFARDNAQAFTTGSHSLGYTLTQVDFEISIGGTGADPTHTTTAQIRKAGSSGRPGGDLVGTLTSPGDFSADVDSFTHTGLDLDPDTTYFVVLDVSAQTRGDRIVLESTTSDDEDSSSVTGWSIDNKRWARAFGTTTWAAADEKDSALQIGVWATANPPTALSAELNTSARTIRVTFDEDLNTATPEVAQFSLQDSSDADIASTTPSSVSIAGAVVTARFSSIPSNAAKIKYTPSSSASRNPLQDPSGNQVAAFSQAYSKVTLGSDAANRVLVGNINTLDNQLNRTIDEATFDLAQSFRTGAHSGGYRLTEAKIKFGQIPQSHIRTAPTFTVQVCPASGSNPDPASCLGTLNQAASITSGVLPFTASGNGIDLSASTTYYVLVTTTAAGSGGHWDIVTTFIGDEDLGRDPGWSIGNDIQLKQHASGSSWVTFDDALEIQVRGRAKETTAPTAQSYEISGSTLIITYDRELNGNAPAAGQFKVKIGSAAEADASAVSISGKRVTLTTASAASSSDTVQARYVKPASGATLKDIDGNEVANQASLQSVTNWTGDTTADLVSAVVDGEQVTLTFDRSLNEDSGTSWGDFTTQVEGGVRTRAKPNTVAISGKQVSFELVTSNLAIPGPDRSLTISYTQPSTDKLQDAFGNDVTAFTDQSATNNSPLIKNTGQERGNAVKRAEWFDRDQSQPFTTGSIVGGYTITSLELELTGDSSTGTGTYQVSIREADPESTLPTSVNKGTLTNPTKLVRGLNTFTAPGSGIRLDPDTTYAILVDFSASGGAFHFVSVAKGKDAGAATGWSLANARVARAWNGTDWNAAPGVLALKIRGTIDVDETAPTVLHAGLHPLRKTIAITFDETLTTDTPAASQFSLQDSSGADIANSSPSSVSIAGAVVTATFSSIPSGAAKIKYAPSSTASDNPLQDASGNQAAAFSQDYTQGVRVVSNTGQTTNTTLNGNVKREQKFTTGGYAPGYKLTGIDIDLGEATGTAPTYTVKLQDHGGTDLATFTNPSSLAVGANRFTLSTPQDLNANTTYQIFWDQSSGSTTHKVATTLLDAEDAGGAPGWSIGDGSRVRLISGTNWTANINSNQIAVYAYENEDTIAPTVSSAAVNGEALTVGFSEPMDTTTAPASSVFTVTATPPGGAARTIAGSSANVTFSADGFTVSATLSSAVAVGEVVTAAYVKPASNPLQDAVGNELVVFTGQVVTNITGAAVSNTGQADEHTDNSNKPAFNHDHAQQFTTGSNSSGYTLTQVDWEITDTAVQAATVTYTMEIRKAGSSGRPGGDLVGTLTNPNDFSGAVDSFTHTGLTLEADTTYFAVLDVSAATNGNVFVLESTTSDDEDTGGLAGWSIADKRWARTAGQDHWAAADEQDSALQIAVVATANAPTVSSAEVDGRTVTLTYDKALDTGSTPATTAYTVTVAGQARTVTRVVVSGSTVTLTISGASVIGGQTVTLSYAVPAANPIQDSTGGVADDLTNQAVTVHGITAIAFTTQPTGNYASIGGHVEVTLSFSQAATVTFTPRIRLAPALRGQTRYAAYVSGSGTTELVFRYTLVDGDNSGTTNISVPRNGLDANGAANNATIRFGTANAPAGHIALDSGKTAKVAAPSVELAFAAPTTDGDLDGSNETYVAGDGITVTMRFTEPMAVNNGGSNSNVQVVVTIGSSDHTLNFISASGSDLEFGSRTVAAADADTDGIAIKRDGSNNLVRLSGGGTITSAANSNAAVLTATADLGVRADADDATSLVLVRGTNAAPTGADFTVTTNKNVDLAFAVTDFAITDANGDPLKEVQIVSLPDSAHGTLMLDGTAIAAVPRTVTRAQLDDGDLVFSPVAEFLSSDTAIPTFTFKVVDSFGGVAASANTATIKVVPGPPLAAAVANARTLALVYERQMDPASVPPTSAFTVKVEGSAVNVTRVAVSGQTVTLTLARSVTADHVVTVSYTKGAIANPLQDTDGFDAADLMDQAVSTAPLTVEEAYITRDGMTLTLQLSEKNLRDSFRRTDWSLRIDGRGSWRYPNGGSFDAAEGIVVLTFTSPVTWTETLMLRYSSTRVLNHAGKLLAGFSNQEIRRQVPPNAACTMGPGPDPWNPLSPCGTGPHDPTTAPGAYKSIGNHTQAEANAPPPPKYVRIDCSDQDPTDCTIKFKGWTFFETYRGYHNGQVLTLEVGGHVYKTFLWAELEQDPESTATCGTRRHLEETIQGVWDNTHFGRDPNLEASHDVSLSTPSNLPSGCVVKSWVAAVVLDRGSDRSHSGSTVAFHEPS